VQLHRFTTLQTIYIFFLDNLFLNVKVANALLAQSVLCIDTTRKDTTGVPKQLTTLKNTNK
jgi:hypothetical protein